MKSLVVGAMLLHKMNAQQLNAGVQAAQAAAVGVPVAPVVAPAANVPAPVITPGINAPSEAELLGPAVADLPVQAFAWDPDLPRGTADVVLDQPTSASPFGAGSTPGTGISFGPNILNDLDADVVPATVAPAGIVDAPVQNLAAAVPSVASPGGFNVLAVDDPLPVNAAPVDAAPVDTVPADTVPVDAAPVNAVPLDATPVDAVPVDAAPVPVDAVPVEGAPVDAVPVDTTSSTIVVVDPAGTTSSTIIVDVNPIQTSSAIVDENPVQTSSTIIVTPTPIPTGIALPIGTIPFSDPYDPYSIYDPASPYYDPYAAPPGWEGDDNGNYDGEDDYQSGANKRPTHVGPSYDDDAECPAWCLDEDSYPSYPTSTPDYEYSPYKTTPTPKYPEYTPVADPYQEYEPTSEYDPYPEEYPTSSYEAKPYPVPTPNYKEYPPKEPEYYPEPEDNSYPQLKRVRSFLRAVRRQAFSWPQPSYTDDDDSGDYDGEDGSIPDWLYDIDGAPKKPVPSPKPKPKCPKSCYKPKTTDYGYETKPARPTYTMTRKGGYDTTKDSYQTTEEPYYPGPTSEAGYYPDETTDVPYPEETTYAPYPDETTDAPYPDYTSTAWYPQGNSTTPAWPTDYSKVPDESTVVPYEPTVAPYEPTVAPYEPTSEPSKPTTLVTQYQPQPYPEQTGGAWSDPGSPVGDYTGDTLDSLCPNTCNPFNPALNFCDITTGCATTGGSKYYCACRAGFRADNYNAKDFSKQFKVAGQPYVYLAVSTSCNTPCSDQTCSEVLERSQCK